MILESVMMTTTEHAGGLLSPAFDFESIYADAAGDRALIPWEDGQAHPALIHWLNAVAPSLIRCGSRVAVVGCGLGDDARALIHRGYDVTAFDCSPSAVEWARRIDPVNASSYFVADLFNMPVRWRHRFDLVVEVNTLQSLGPDLRPEALAALAELLSPHGHLLVIARGRTEETVETGPPWPIGVDELTREGATAGLVCDEGISRFFDDESDPPTPRVRGLFRRA